MAATAAAILLTVPGAKAQWHPAGDKIKTPWAEKVDYKRPWNVYPRPQLKRAAWLNLNGLWNYAVTGLNASTPSKWDGQILVPYPIESSLSGVGRTLTKDNLLWYDRTFTVPAAWKGKHVKLNFGAVDWKADVYVNGTRVGSHTGGYAPFSIDITPALKAGVNKLTVKVFDPSSDGYQPVGKQKSKAEGIWYTPASGIWQTVWLEPVSSKYISSLLITPDVDRSELVVTPEVIGAAAGDKVSITVKSGKTVIASGSGEDGKAVALRIASPKLWSPDSPFLYSLDIKVISGDNPHTVSRIAAAAGIANADRYAPTCGNVNNPSSGSYEWYMTQFINATKAKGATPILVTTTLGMKAYSGGKFVNSYTNYNQACYDLAKKCGYTGEKVTPPHSQ